MNKLLKILNVFMFLSLLIIIGYLSITLESEKGYKIEKIEIKGDNLITAKQYLNFAMLDNKDQYAEINLQIIKKRIEKHPYIESVSVSYSTNNTVEIIVKEKSIKALLNYKNTQYLLTEEFILLPLLP